MYIEKNFTMVITITITYSFKENFQTSLTWWSFLPFAAFQLEKYLELQNILKS
jgi:hypothetical protein